MKWLKDIHNNKCKTNSIQYISHSTKEFTTDKNQQREALKNRIWWQEKKDKLEQ
jgi:hypothetical protein